LKPSPVFVGLVQAMLGQSTLAEAALAPAAEKA
jgi:hypothetical protein